MILTLTCKLASERAELGGLRSREGQLMRRRRGDSPRGSTTHLRHSRGRLHRIRSLDVAQVRLQQAPLGRTRAVAVLLERPGEGPQGRTRALAVLP
jgi:hypothetical protein